MPIPKRGKCHCSQSKSVPRVALIIETSNQYGRGLLKGIRNYLEETEAWSIYFNERSRTDADLSWLTYWEGDGIIARIENPKIASHVVQKNVPIVDVSAARLIPDIPSVETNDEVIARLAAQHLLGRGFRSFGYSGDPRFMWSQLRAKHFAKCIEEAGFGCSIYNVADENSGYPSWDNVRANMAEWLQSLVKPAAIMAGYDIRGQQILDACHLASISVPHDLAVIGVDNDELICELSYPPLTSIVPDAVRAGYVAANQLSRLMNRETVSTEQVLIEPLGIVERLSTDVIATEDRVVADAIRLIRDQACTNMTVEEMLRALPYSRRVLENRFRKSLGHTPHDEIVNVKIKRIKELLAASDLSLIDIAEQTGFPHPEYMSVMFKRQTGMTPSQYRKYAQG